MGRLTIMQEAREKRSKKNRIAEIRNKADLPILDKTPSEVPTRVPTFDRPGTDVSTDKVPTKYRPKVGHTDLSTNPDTDAPTKVPTKVPTLKSSDDPVWYISDIQAVVLWYLINDKSKVASRETISGYTNIKKSTVKTSIRRLSALGFISKPRRLKNLGASYQLFSEPCKRFIDQRWPMIKEKYGEPPQVPTNIPTRVPTKTPTDTGTDPSLIIEEDLKTLLLEIKYKFTKLSALGFGHPQLSKIVAAWKNNSMALDRLSESLRRVEYALEHGKLFEKKDPLNYVYVSLVNGEYARPNGYKSPAELQAEAELEEQRRVEAIRKQAADLEFLNMLADPAGELYQQCLRRMKEHSHDHKYADPAHKMHKATMRKHFDAIKAEIANR